MLGGFVLLGAAALVLAKWGMQDQIAGGIALGLASFGIVIGWMAGLGALGSEFDAPEPGQPPVGTPVELPPTTETAPPALAATGPNPANQPGPAIRPDRRAGLTRNALIAGGVGYFLGGLSLTQSWLYAPPLPPHPWAADPHSLLGFLISSIYVGPLAGILFGGLTRILGARSRRTRRLVILGAGLGGLACGILATVVASYFS